MVLRCIAVDDEYLALDVVRRYIQKIPFLELLDSFDSALSAMSFLSLNQVDLLFLDIQMKELSGFALLKSLKNPPLVILTTAYDNYAVKSYDFDILDYLLKPISFERFVRSTNKAYNKFAADQSIMPITKEPVTISTKAEDYCFIKSGTSLERISFDDILYIKGERDYLRIVTEQKYVLVLHNFKHFEDLLSSKDFYRVHKSYMVSLNKIKKIDNNMILIGDINIPIGNIYKAAFFQAVLKERG